MTHRWTRRIAALAFACLPLMAGAATPWPRMTGESPLHPDLLPPDRVAAIVAEAQRVAAVRHPGTPVTPLPDAWETLDRQTLAALIRMPVWAQIENPVHDDTHDSAGVLLDQAATWDLLEFRRPSDVARLWAHLWPESVERPVENDRHFIFGTGYMPDPTWSVRSRAMASILGCLPNEAWELDADVMVERNRRHWAQSDRGDDAFRGCVERTARFLETDEGYTPPHDPPGIENAVVELLKDRFTAEIAVDGCSRPGPDGCLVLLDAVLSLDGNDPRLPGLFRRIEPGFQLDTPIDVPDITPSNDDGPSPNDARLEVPEGEALRRIVYLRLKTRQLLRRPEHWPAGELDRTLAQAARAGLVLNDVRSRMSRQRNREVYGIDYDAWLRDLVKPDVARRIAGSQRALAVELARAAPCRYAEQGRDEWDVFTGTADFWTTYNALSKQSGTTCNADR
ncbi:hypothetical protein [Lysobacter sp. HA35]